MSKTKVHVIEAVVWFIAWGLLDDTLQTGLISGVMLITFVTAGICLLTQGSFTETVVRAAHKRFKQIYAAKREELKAKRAAKRARLETPTANPRTTPTAPSETATQKPYAATLDPNRVN